MMAAGICKVWVYYGLMLVLTWSQISSTENTLVEQGKEVVADFYSRFSSKEVDVVFILDRSASVPRTGWESMLSFVQSFLEFFTLNHDNTRLAIVTFSTRVSVDINDLDEGRENKCSMMQKIKLRLGQKALSGYTATNEAMASAKTILINSRRTAKKAVFILTDGKSNIGPAPVQASIALRSLRWDSRWNTTARGPQLEIYAFGIKDAYMPELRSLASPLPNHTYFIPDFRTFEQLARSLHDGEQQETWDVLSDRGRCDDRCSEHAICACATRSGQYVCVCRAGYYGNGFECSECPRGSYKDSLSPHLCVPCPGNSTTILPGATSKQNCACQPPYHHTNNICQLRSCPVLADVSHAHKFNVIGRIRDEVRDTGEDCANTPETSCHYRCDTGYRLNSHPGLICNMNGTWTGRVPSCHVVDCSSLDYHGQQSDHSRVTYRNTTTTYQSQVHVQCDTGWRLFGNATRVCTQHGTWSGIAATCIEALCPAIHLPRGGVISPAQCSSSRQLPGQRCSVSCRRGFQHHGPSDRVCTPRGNWNVIDETRCVDVERPEIICPADITTPVTSSNYAVVHWDALRPRVADNAGESGINVQTVGVSASPAQLAVGYHQIRYVARDAAGNEASCNQGIHVVEKLIRMEFCPNDIRIQDVQGAGYTVSWEGPLFLDNTNSTVPHVCSIPEGSVFPIGTRNVRCTPQDNVPNLPSCTFSVTLQRIQCHHPREPLHGSVTCARTSAAITLCSVKCNDNYDFYQRPQIMYKCLNGQWQLRQNNTWWPDCSRRMHPRRASMRAHAEYFYYGGSCENKRDEIGGKFRAWVQSQSWEVCGAALCPLEDIQVSCGQQSRRKRMARNHNRGHAITGHLQEDDMFQNLREGGASSEMDREFVSSDNGQSKGSTTSNGDNAQSVTTASLLQIPLGAHGKAPLKKRPKRSMDEKQPPTTVSAIERHFPVLSGDLDPKSRVSMHPTVSVSSEHTEEVEEIDPADELIVEEPAYVEPLETTTSTMSLVSETENESTASTSTGRFWSVFSTHTPSLNSVKTDLTSIDTTQQPFTDGEASTTSLLSETTVANVNETTGAESTQISEESLPTQGTNSSGKITISFSLSMSSNISEMTMTEQMAVVDLLYGMVDSLDERMRDSNISLSENNTDDTLVSATHLDYDDPHFDDCEPGQIAASHTYQSKSCVLCPVGTYSTNSTCVPCPLGQYQDEEGQLTCHLCPDITTTATNGATNSSDCRDPCPRGHYSSTGLAPCTLCPKALYQNSPGSISCKECPPGMATRQEGSPSVGDCQQLCPNGSFGVGGVEPCELCPMTSFQPLEGQHECLFCPGNKMTSEMGSVAEDQCLDFDPCSDSESICENGGTCITADHNQTSCLCPLGFTDHQCQTNIQECNSDPCLHNATCVDDIGHFSCICSSGYTGTICELDLDTCLSSPCRHGGSCEDLGGDEGYHCHCLPRYTGQDCQLYDDCNYYDYCVNGDPYEDNGMCKCDCQPGFLGTYCDILVDLCLTFPCENSKKCHTFQDDFECDCLPGYIGKTCSEEVDECLSNPCVNGGQCFDRLDGYFCKCPGGFSGTYCQQEVSPDFDLVFLHSSSVSYASFPRETIPIMSSFTSCLWTRTHQMFGSGTLFSYGVPAHEDTGDMTTLLQLRNMGNLEMTLFEEEVPTEISLAPDAWHHVCVKWSGDGGTWSVYVNGSLQASGVGVGEGGEMVGGGLLVIGQQQSSDGNMFNIWESFIGEISQFNIYDEVLPSDAIRRLANQSQCSMSYGSALAWTQVLGALYGDVMTRESHCLDVNECALPTVFPCPSNHLCQDNVGGYNCSTCQYGYHGNGCQEPVNECTLGLCQNGASCSDGPEPWDLVCNCHRGYTGHFCEDMIDFCVSQPCVNDGVCVPVVGGHRCECPSLNTGPNCEDLGTSCTPNPCQHGGVCTPHGDHFTCHCLEGYNGTRCETSTTHCHVNICQNRGACVIQYGRPICYCDLEWRGQRCEVEVIADCSLSPCLNGGRCEEVASEVGYLCHCNGDSGVALDEHCGYASPCQSYPCADRGVCVSMPNNTYMCDCMPGFRGRQCEIQGGPTISTPSTTSTTTIKALCIPSMCLNGGSCQANVGCICLMEYAGSRCHIQKHAVTTHYKGKMTVLVPYTTRNKVTVEAEFPKEVEEELEDLKSTGHLDVTLTSMKASPDSSEMEVKYWIDYTQYMNSLSEKIDYMDIRTILHDSAVRGNLGSLHTSIKGFKFRQVFNTDSDDQTPRGPDHMTVYLTVGLVVTLLVLVGVSVWVGCKVHRHRKRQLNTHSLLPNNTGNINLTMLSNPVFDRSDEDRRTRGSMTDENPYAEFSEAILPYEVTYSTKANVKDCNIVLAAARKTSEASLNSPKKEEEKPKTEDYLSPVPSKNELSQLPDLRKDEKKLLPDLKKTCQNVEECDYLEPLNSKTSPANCQTAGYVNEGRGQGQGQGSNQGDSDKNQEPLKSQTSGYVNEPQGRIGFHSSDLSANQAVPYLEMQTTTNSKDSIRFVNEHEEILDVKQPMKSPIDRLAYMINKPVRSVEDDDGTYLEPINQRPPDYLPVHAPLESELPLPDPAKRKLPPLPK